MTFDTNSRSDDFQPSLSTLDILIPFATYFTLVGFALVLLTNLPLDDVGIILSTLAVSELCARLIVDLVTRGGRIGLSARLLVAWITFVALSIYADSQGLNLRLDARSGGIISIILLVMLRSVALLKTTISGHVESTALGPVSAAIISCSMSANFTIDRPAIVIIFLTTYLIAAGWTSVRLISTAVNTQATMKATNTQDQLSTVDILLFPVLLSPSQAAIYLLARGAAHIISLSQRALLQVVRVPQSRPKEILSIAPRLNIGFLLVTGSMIVAVSVTSNAISRLTPDFPSQMIQVLYWFLIAQGVIAAFGPTGFLLRATQLSFLDTGLRLLATLILIALLLGSRNIDAYFFAKSVACVSIAQTTLSAIALIACLGIWPGVSGLLHRGIKFN